MAWFGSTEDLLAHARSKARDTPGERLVRMAAEYRRLMLDLLPDGDPEWLAEPYPSVTGLDGGHGRWAVLEGGAFVPPDRDPGDATGWKSPDDLAGTYGLPAIEAAMREGLRLAADRACYRSGDAG